MVRSLSSRHTACFEDKSKGSHFLWCGFWCRVHGLLELIERLLQPVVPLGAMDFPVGVSPFADSRVMPLFNADSLVSGISILNLLVVDSAVSDHGLHQSMAKTGPIGCACFRNTGSIAIFGGTAYLRHFCEQDLASDLHQPFAERQGWGSTELMHFFSGKCQCGSSRL